MESDAVHDEKPLLQGLAPNSMHATDITRGVWKQEAPVKNRVSEPEGLDSICSLSL